MAEAPTATVLVCCYTFDRFADTVAAVRSVFDQTLPAQEVLVVVDHNPPLAEELGKALPGAVDFCLNEGQRGTSATRNAGVARASGEVVAFLDDDAVAERDWLENLLGRFRNPNAMVVGGSSVPEWEQGAAPPWFPREYEFIFGCTGHIDLVLGEDGQVRNATGSNMAVRREVFEQLGGWTTELGRGSVKTGGEEAELCLRIRSAMPEALILYEPSALVHHKVPRQRSTLRYVFTYAYHEGTVRALLEKRLAHYTARPLAGERAYLRGLLLEAIPARLRRIYRPQAIAQLLVILANTTLVALGYARGRLAHR